jgi:hypothetical protein
VVNGAPCNSPVGQIQKNYWMDPEWNRLPGGEARLGGPDLFNHSKATVVRHDTIANTEHLTSLRKCIRIVVPKRARDWQRFSAIPKPNDCPGISFELQSCTFVVHLCYFNV